MHLHVLVHVLLMVGKVQFSHRLCLGVIKPTMHLHVLVHVLLMVGKVQFSVDCTRTIVISNELSLLWMLTFWRPSVVFRGN